METLRKYGAKYNTTFCSFAGLSTDTKPVGTVLIDDKSVVLANGSEFIEMDTDKKYLYDAENQTWNQVASGGGGGGGGGGSGFFSRCLIADSTIFYDSDHNPYIQPYTREIRVVPNNSEVIVEPKTNISYFQTIVEGTVSTLKIKNSASTHGQVSVTFKAGDNFSFYVDGVKKSTSLRAGEVYLLSHYWEHISAGWYQHFNFYAWSDESRFVFEVE